MTEITTQHFMVVAMLLFAIGAAGALSRRSGLMVLMCIELMLNAANIVLVGYANRLDDASAHVVAFFVMAIAAAEAAIGLSLFIGIFRTHGTIDLQRLDILKDEY